MYDDDYGNVQMLAVWKHLDAAGPRTPETVPELSPGQVGCASLEWTPRGEAQEESTRQSNGTRRAPILNGEER
jgi:hypothetical protein